ncbi:hypothetical protein NDU88_006675 [Pleurodeles waltl]|uniref:Uncharacterized protein n=1 Tax=Pleurodeles waltl TaxID=8319 RepID=A0AAV7L6H3_PLEWA|nr:hypothetical protein NDU88_006675 [Pleurodeles waltl]
MEPSGLSAVRRGNPQSPRYGQTLGQNGAVWAVAVRRGHPQRPWYGLTLVQNGGVWAVGRQARAPTETPVRTDTCTEWSPPGCQRSGECYRDPGTDRHLYRMEPSGLSVIRQGHPQRPRYGLSAFRRGHPRRSPVRAVSRQARASTETPVRAVRRGLQRPQYGWTLVQNGAVSRQARAPTETPVRAVSCQARAPAETPVWAVSLQARAPTETPVRADACTEWSPPGCQLSSEGTHGDPGTDRHLYRMEPSGLSAVRRGHPRRPLYGQTLVQNGAVRALSRQAMATETTVLTDTCTEWSPPGCQLPGEGTHRDPGTGCQPSGEGTHGDPGTDRHLYRMELSAFRRGHPQRPRYGQTLVQNEALGAVSRQARAPTETPVRADASTEWSRPGCHLSGDGHRDPGTDRHLYTMEPSGLSAVRQGHPQRPQYGLSAFRRGNPQRPR